MIPWTNETYEITLEGIALEAGMKVYAVFWQQDVSVLVPCEIGEGGTVSCALTQEQSGKFRPSRVTDTEEGFFAPPEEMVHMQINVIADGKRIGSDVYSEIVYPQGWRKPLGG